MHRMLEVRTLDRSDIPAALALCEQANWNHVAADWERCLALNPEACLGRFRDGVLGATCTLTRFGKAGWVGTFLVDEALRGKGCWRGVFETMLEVAHGQGIECLALDSSDAGRRIYLKYGFQMTGQGVELWTGPPDAASDSDAAVRILQASDWDQLLAFDRDRVNVCREQQLRLLANEDGATARVLTEGSDMLGFGFSRPGRLSGAIGPVVASDLQRACRIVGALMADRRRFDGEKPVGMAVLDRDDFKSWLAGRGFRMLRRNIRMFRPEPRDVLSGASVFASTGLGMG
jgi:GNAT superfamily N-acetyltransferase